jgi:hypothetical protein
MARSAARDSFPNVAMENSKFEVRNPKSGACVIAVAPYLPLSLPSPAAADMLAGR